MTPRRIAIVGFGKIASDQHAPAIAASSDFLLAGSVSRAGTGPAPHFESLDALLDSVGDLHAAAITTSPGPRYALAQQCIAAGLDVLLEKPPTVTLGEVQDLADFAKERGVVLYSSWHARHHPAVQEAARRLAGKRIVAMQIIWHEDVDKWHPGQRWIWEPGGFGVFDPGINALSIATHIFPATLTVSEARLGYRADAQSPITAELTLSSPAGEGPLHCSFDWRRREGEEWTIRIETTDGERLELLDGGARLMIDGSPASEEGIGEYPDIYRHFAGLIAARRSDVDIEPLRLVADALLLAQRIEVE